MQSNIRLNNGVEREGKTRFRSTGVAPKYDQLATLPDESLYSMTVRAYGESTPTLQQKIRNANATLDSGVINVPR